MSNTRNTQDKYADKTQDIIDFTLYLDEKLNECKYKDSKYLESTFDNIREHYDSYRFINFTVDLSDDNLKKAVSSREQEDDSSVESSYSY